MLEDLDSFDFYLATKLSMTVREMHDRMGNDEYLKWRAYYTYRKAMEDFENGKQQP
jgi:hypothetical protein